MGNKLRQIPTAVNGHGRQAPPVSIELAIAQLELGQRKLQEAIGHVLQMLDAMVAQPPVAKRLLTQAQLCEALQCSRSYVHTLHQLGCPVIRVTDSPRYDLEDVITFMKSRGEQ